MNVIELNRALRQLRLGDMAAVLETRLHQAQAEPMPPIDFLSCLIADELHWGYACPTVLPRWIGFCLKGTSCTSIATQGLLARQRLLPRIWSGIPDENWKRR